jgi:signal transduction histidine kinase
MVDFATLVQRVCDYYQRVANKKEMRITVGCEDQIPQVWTDRVAVAAVLDNLLSNAVKFSQPGKSIWVHVRQDDGFAVCDVRDEGPGLSRQDQGRLFQRGARLTPQPTGGESSTGYGLAVARELVERLGGRIWCQSSSGKGSCFSFGLPLARETTDGAGRD